MEENKIIEQENEKFKGAIKDAVSKIQADGMLLGAQAVCKTILSKIYDFESSNMKKSANDYKRCLKDLKNFCHTGLSKNVDNNEETVQN